MTYKNMDDLYRDIFECDEEEVERLHYLGRLAKVYWDAFYNPPEGVIGVGAVTYAEQKLIEAQEK